MPSEILARSGLLGRGDAGIRNLVVAAFAALGGVVIGGLSVLGVVFAVSPPPNQDALAGSAVFDGPHVVDGRPAAASSRPVAPLAQQSAPLAQQSAPLQAVPATPMPDQAQSPADILRQTWPASDAPAKPKPDALSVRTQGSPDSRAVTTDQTPDTPALAVTVTMNAQGTAIGDNGPKNNSGPDAANGVHDRQAGHLTASRNPAPLALAPNTYQSRRRIVTPPPNDQQARDDDTAEASPGTRPLFDFYGRPVPTIDDGRNQLARQRVIDRGHQQRVIDQDQTTGNAPAQYDTQRDTWGSFFGHDNWTDDRRN
jgi:hypothetical protein